MTQVLSWLHIDTTTAGWLGAVTGAAILFAYANKRVNGLHQQEKQNGPDLTGQYNWLHGLFLFSYGVGLISFVGLAIHSLQVSLLVLIPASVLALGDLRQRVASQWQHIKELFSGLRWPVAVRPVRLGLLGAGGVSTTLGLIEPESMLCFAPFSTDSPANVSAIMAGYFGMKLWTWIDWTAILGILILGSALWQATTRIRQENSFLFPAIEPAYSWRRDSLLLTYVTLLLLLIGLTALISFAPVSEYTFWVGYAAVLLSQLTPAGQRFGNWLLDGAESIFHPTDQAVR